MTLEHQWSTQGQNQSTQLEINTPLQFMWTVKHSSRKIIFVVDRGDLKKILDVGVAACYSGLDGTYRPDLGEWAWFA